MDDKKEKIERLIEKIESEVDQKIIIKFEERLEKGDVEFISINEVKKRLEL